MKELRFFWAQRFFINHEGLEEHEGFLDTDFADLLAGLAYFPGAFFGASTFAIFYFQLTIYYWDLKLPVLSAGHLQCPILKPAKTVRFNFGGVFRHRFHR